MMGLPFWLALGGFLTAWYIYMKDPSIAERIKSEGQPPLYTLLDKKYWFDEAYQLVFARWQPPDR